MGKPRIHVPTPKLRVNKARYAPKGRRTATPSRSARKAPRGGVRT